MYDVAIIGAGVTGSAIARYLSRYQVKACVIEREEDVCDGTSKANSAIVHAGFDAHVGSLKAEMNVKGSKMMEALSKELDFPYDRNGSLVVATKNQDASLLEKLKKQGEENGVEGIRILDEKELKEMEPNLADDVVAALYAPTGAIVCPFNLTIALAENAADNGVEFLLNTSVEKVSREGDHFLIETNGKTIEAKAVVNAAGVYADAINNKIGRAHV